MAENAAFEENFRTEDAMDTAPSNANHAVGKDKEALRENGFVNGTSSNKQHGDGRVRSGDSKLSSSKSSHHKSSHSDKERHHSKHSSSSSRDKSSSKEQKTSSSSHKSGSGDHKSSSDKHKSSSESKDKHRHKDKHHSKERHSSSHSSSKEKGVGDGSERKDKDRVKVKSEPGTDGVKQAPVRLSDDEDDKPLVQRAIKTEAKTPQKNNMNHEVKKRPAADDSDDEPLTLRFDTKKVKKEDVKKVVKKEKISPEKKPSKEQLKLKQKQEIKKESVKRKAEPDEWESPKKKKKKGVKEEVKSPTKKVKKEEPQAWRWWEEQPKAEGVKWVFLEHKGPLFAPDYEPLPSSVKFYYNGKQMKLSQDTEEVAGFYGKMLDHDYTTRDIFNSNFLKDWRKVMTEDERKVIKDISLCNFKEMNEYFKIKSEERKNMSKEEKKKIKEDNAKTQEIYGWCLMDGHKQKIGNFRIEPPGLFRGRGDHPKQGMLKKRVVPEQVIINCSKDSKVPKPPEGRKWAKVKHDNQVTWLASWTENVQGQVKYVMLAPTSRLKGEKDWKKYQTAQKLHKIIDRIRDTYRNDWKSKEMRVRQRSVAMYFIDKLALRAGNEKDEDTADTVGCCSLRCEHITLSEEKDGKEYVVEFDFLGKDSIRYYNEVQVEKRVFKNLQLFMDNKQGTDDLFDRLNTTILNKHLSSIMPGLSAKVFRTYNASRTLEEQLSLLTDPEDPVPAKILAYNRANRAVAILCNHQRAAPKTFDKQMENIQAKIDAKQDVVRECKKAVKSAKADVKAMKTETAKKNLEKKKKAQERAEEQLHKLMIQKTDKSENKEIALGTSKLNYLDPRISVAWCKKWEIPLEKVYNKTQREKFAWAIDMADEDFKFTDFDENRARDDDDSQDEEE